MTRWERVQQIFEVAADLPESARAARLSELCGDDAELRKEVESLLSFDTGTAPFQRAVEETAASLDGPELTHAGPYRLVREIGRGGMGAVYLAVRDDDEFQREVAVKLVKRGMDTDAIVQRFRTERQILALLEHPRIARLYDGGSTRDGRPFLVMEYVPGEPIGAYCQQRSLPLQDRLQLFRQVCEGVEHAHRRLVIHRDLKPSNILVADGQVKLLDFGIAKLLDADAQHTMAMTGVRMLTPEYASPEQVRGDPVTTATDIYALGAVLFELLTGMPAHPLQTGSMEELERVVCGGVAPVAGAGDELDHIVQMAMRLEPERRYASVAHLSDDVARYLDHRPVLARPDSVSYRAAKFVRRHRGGVAAAALVLVSLVGGILGTAWQAHRANENARRAEERFNQVRRLANVFLFDVEAKISTLPGATEARELLTRTATEYLDSLVKEASGDTGLQLELANAYLRVGDVQGNSGQPNLGRPKDAVVSYAKGAALMEQLRANGDAPPESLLLLARLESALSGASARTSQSIQSAEHRQRALELVREYRRARPNDDAAIALEVESLAQLSADLTHRGDYQRALQYIEQAHPLLQLRSPGKESKGLRALLYYRKANTFAVMGRLEDAVEQMRTSVGLREQLGREYPMDARLQAQLLRAYNELGGMLGDPDENNLGRYGEAITFFEKANGIAEAQYRNDPNSSFAPTNLGYGLTGIGRIYCELGKPREALPYFDRAIQIKERVAARDPGNHGARIDLASFLIDRSVAHRLNGAPAQEMADLRASVALHRKVAAERAGNRSMLLNLVLPMQYLGAALARAGDRKEAEAVFSEALSIAAITTTGSRTDFHLYHKTGLLMEAARFHGGARRCELLGEAVPYLQEMKKRGVPERRWKADLEVASRPCP